jgi:hypothetical protein
VYLPTDGRRTSYIKIAVHHQGTVHVHGTSDAFKVTEPSMLKVLGPVSEALHSGKANQEQGT